MKFLTFVPKSYLSWFIGMMANIPLPQPIAGWLIGWFISAYKIDPSTATRSLKDFRSIGEFFTRDLKPELRPIAEGIVCPVDGTLRVACDLSTGGEVTQIKGKTFTVPALVGQDPLASRFEKGQLWNYYLSPQDAHHIFSPVDGTIVRTVHIPGKLWPVNNWALSSIDELFCVNERIVTFIESSHGLVAVVMVGATNVGRIKLAYHSLETNTAPWVRHSQRTIEHIPPRAVKRGEKIGTFKMGSSVLLVFEARVGDVSRVVPLSKVTYGARLA
jgi:phosphatidylserine decarboxylase